jgi:hypothetical protein
LSWLTLGSRFRQTGLGTSVQQLANNTEPSFPRASLRAARRCSQGKRVCDQYAISVTASIFLLLPRLCCHIRLHLRKTVHEQWRTSLAMLPSWIRHSLLTGKK